MESVLNNPYRVIGILVGTSRKDEHTKTQKLKMYIDAEAEVPEDFCFPLIGSLNRSLAKVDVATSKLNLDNDRINAALFWFYKGNEVTDEPAFDFLKENDHQNAIQTWTKKIGTSEINQNNCSAYHNLSTLLYCNAFEGSNINSSLFEQGVHLKLKFLDSDYIKGFKTLAADATFKTTKKELQFLFLNQVKSEIDKHGGVSADKFIDILNNQVFSAKADYLNEFIQKPIEKIENKIEETKKRQKDNKARAGDYGNDLYKSTKKDLALIKSILGSSNIKFISISDKLANEILQCSITLFNHFYETDTEVGETALDLDEKAKSIAIGSIVKERIEESIPVLLKYIDDRANREKQKRIKVDFDNLKAIIDENENKTDTVVNANQLLSNAKQYLDNIKSIIGNTDELYLILSSRIASDAQSMCVGEINKIQSTLNTVYDSTTKTAIVRQLKGKVNEAWNVVIIIGHMDLSQSFRVKYNSNKASLSSIKSQLATVDTGGGGCYIATMAYGDYDHPQVLILRQFRDEFLDKSKLGKWFIKTYYHYSPKLVEKLKNKITINNIIRKILNQIINLIKK
ncbi:MAG: hypothetical protein ACI87N_000107 [Flavobacteriales bacterium]|jgi:hypothetical protein